MKKFSFAVVSFILSLVLFIPASLIYLVSFLKLSESNPLVVLTSFSVFLSYLLPEIPLGMISQPLGFPVVLPALAILFAVISYLKKESRRSLAITSIVLVLLNIGMYLMVQILF